MKRRGSILILSILMVLLSFNFVSAAGLELTSTYPTEGYNKVEPKNVMIKLFFNEEISSAESQTANKDNFTLKNPEGKDVAFEVLYDSKDTSKICLVLEEDLVSSSKYTLSIAQDLRSDDGDILGSDAQLTFQTRNTDSDGNVNMLLMGVMVVVMIFFTMRDAKKTAAAENEDTAAVAIPSNPYKYAKEKGISVEQAVKEINEIREKNAKKSGSSSKSQKSQTSSSEKSAGNGKKATQDKQKSEPVKQIKKVKTKRRVNYKK